MFYLVLLAFLVLPPLIVGVWAWIGRSKTLALWLVPSLAPLIWMTVSVVRVFSEQKFHPGMFEILGPSVLGCCELIVLWFVYRSKDPMGAGLLLAGVEGVTAVAQVRGGHPYLGAATGVSALIQADASMHEDATGTDQKAYNFVDFIRGKPDPHYWVSADMNYSHDWCRYRGFQHCWFSGVLNEEASESVGYAVHEPVDRGRCMLQTWESQMHNCPVAEPGPNAAGTGRSEGYLEAWIPWEAGGQRLIPLPRASDYRPKPATHRPPSIDPVTGPSRLTREDVERLRSDDARPPSSDGTYPPSVDRSAVAPLSVDLASVEPAPNDPARDSEFLTDPVQGRSSDADGVGERSVVDDPEVLAEIARIADRAKREIVRSLVERNHSPGDGENVASETDGSIGLEISRLAALRDAGDLTVDEYQILKARLLDGAD